MMNKKIDLSIIGGGTAALFLAAFLDENLFSISLFEKKSSLGRKFLVAGDGGFNLTHGEEIDLLIDRYTPVDFLRKALSQFNNQDLIHWLQKIDIATFIGSSNRVFPEKGVKPIQVLNKFKSILEDKGVQCYFNHEFTGWDDDNRLLFNNNKTISSDIQVFALGGASWKVTGSDGGWHNIFQANGINTTPFQASNCAFEIAWKPEFLAKNEGSPLKNIAISIGDQIQKGEVVITKFGLEGNAIYALSKKIQKSLSNKIYPTIHIDFKPNVTKEKLLEKLKRSNLNNTQTLKQKLKLSKAQIDLIKTTLSKTDFLTKTTLAENIKNFPLQVLAAAPIDEAISTIGGICLESIHQNYECKALPNTFCIGEMLDWNAPTGGYLIQACASMGVRLSRILNSQHQSLPQ